ncbi:MAG: hypothetical protein VB034_11395 [Eubacteriales bacterium]|nr:hypothetical protein [Eubacteriales bacterium]
MRSLLSRFPTEPIKLTKKDGTEIVVNSALVDPSGKLITIEDVSVNVEEDDIISRSLPNGDVERFIVVDRGFVRGMHNIPDHYQIKVKKRVDNPYLNSPQSVTTYNISNTQKVNIHSVDNSKNYTLTQNEKEMFDKLVALAESLPNKDSVIPNIRDMEHAAGTTSFAGKYNEFIQSVANHIAIFTPFIPLLTSLIVK